MNLTEPSAAVEVAGTVDQLEETMEPVHLGLNLEDFLLLDGEKMAV